MAEEIALLDQLSRGRAFIGIGSGYQRFEFEAFGADLAERQERMLEIWQIIDQAVHENRFAHDGNFYRLPDVPQAIRLYRPRRVDSFFVSWTPGIIAHAVKVGGTPFITVGWGDTATLKSMRGFVDTKYKEAGHGSSERFAAQRYVFVSDDAAEIRKVAEGVRYAGRSAGHMRIGAQVLEGHRILDRPLEGEPSLEEIEANLPIGNADKVAEQLMTEIETIGITDLSCFMWPAGMPARSALRSMERFGSDVLPKIDKALAERPRQTAEAVFG